MEKIFRQPWKNVIFYCQIYSIYAMDKQIYGFILAIIHISCLLPGDKTIPELFLGSVASAVPRAKHRVWGLENLIILSTYL